jgi:hypothetical protein
LFPSLKDRDPKYCQDYLKQPMICPVGYHGGETSQSIQYNAVRFGSHLLEHQLR